jgi:hypothetical protein
MLDSLLARAQGIDRLPGSAAISKKSAWSNKQLAVSNKEETPAENASAESFPRDLGLIANCLLLIALRCTLAPLG